MRAPDPGPPPPPRGLLGPAAFGVNSLQPCSGEGPRLATAQVQI